MLLLHGGRASTHEYFEAFDSYFPGAGIEYYYYDQLGSYYSDQPDEPDAVGAAALRRGSRAGAAGARPRQGQLLSARPVVGRHAGDRVRAQVPAEPQGPGHLEHDVEHPRRTTSTPTNVLMPAMDQKVLAEIKQIEATGRVRQPALHGAADPAPLRPARPAHAARAVARPGEPRLQAHQPGDLRPDAGPERARRQRQARELGPQRRPRQDHRADAGHRRAARHDGPRAHGVDGQRRSRTGATCYCPNGSHMAEYDDQQTYFTG